MLKDRQGSSAIVSTICHKEQDLDILECHKRFISRRYADIFSIFISLILLLGQQVIFIINSSILCLIVDTTKLSNSMTFSLGDNFIIINNILTLVYASIYLLRTRKILTRLLLALILFYTVKRGSKF